MKRLKYNQLWFNISKYLCYALVRITFATYRVRITYGSGINKPLNSNQAIFYAWHQDLVASAIFLFKNKFSSHCIISPSRDGQLVGFITKKLGLQVLYGSAHKQTIPLIRQSLNILKTEKQLFVIGDGSRGPAKQLQQGVIYFAKKSNLPLIFIECSASWKITFKKSWDQFQIPLPFSKIYITIHSPCSFK